MPTPKRDPEEIRKHSRNFSRINHFTDKTPVLKFYQMSLRDPAFNRIGIRVYDLAEVVAEKIAKDSKEVTFGDFKSIDYAIFHNLNNIGPGTYAALNGLRQGVADNEKDGRKQKAEKVLAEQLSFAALDQIAEPVAAEIPTVNIEKLKQEIEVMKSDSSHYDLGHTAGQAHAYLNIIKLLGGKLTSDPESSSTIIGLLKTVADMHEKVVGQ
jgi:hypothetical protein